MRVGKGGLGHCVRAWVGKQDRKAARVAGGGTARGSVSGAKTLLSFLDISLEIVCYGFKEPRLLRGEGAGRHLQEGRPWAARDTGGSMGNNRAMWAERGILVKVVSV